MTTLEFWFDPICPFTWNTSLWVRDVAPARDTEVRWRPYSLGFKHEGQEIPERFRRPQRFGVEALRVVQRLSEDGREDAVGALYLELGRRIHHDRAEPGPDLLADALAAAGLEPELAAAAEDESLDAGIRASMADALALAGDDVGVPILSFDDEPKQGFFGPVVSPPPTGEEALVLWDAFRAAVRLPGFFEIKRSRDGLELGPRP